MHFSAKECAVVVVGFGKVPGVCLPKLKQLKQFTCSRFIQHFNVDMCVSDGDYDSYWEICSVLACLSKSRHGGWKRITPRGRLCFEFCCSSFQGRWTPVALRRVGGGRNPRVWSTHQHTLFRRPQFSLSLSLCDVREPLIGSVRVPGWGVSCYCSLCCFTRPAGLSHSSSRTLFRFPRPAGSLFVLKLFCVSDNLLFFLE